jgi:hypothetical protein
MCLAGQAGGHGATDLYSASLPDGAPIGPSRWALTRDEAGALQPLAPRSVSRDWDGRGGRHCPSYVRGWDPVAGAWVERIYYAGAAENLWGPYTIGYLEWDGRQWIDQPCPAFVAEESWERGSVYEPNLVYHDGTWRMWYVAGSNRDGYLVQGYAESDDGRTGWRARRPFAPPELAMFDFAVRPRGDAFEAVFARIALNPAAPSPDAGLWWCRADTPSAVLSDWSEPVQIMTAADRGWHAGPWKPSFEFADADRRRALVFFDGSYRTSDPGPFPFAFTLGCLEIDLPA